MGHLQDAIADLRVAVEIRNRGFIAGESDIRQIGHAGTKVHQAYLGSCTNDETDTEFDTLTPNEEQTQLHHGTDANEARG